ncbi:MAG: Hpt domain-containing protein [Rhodospirillales bacterium]|nr:Hpt domain-containing protein [Rhodospirillales bacterium]
MPVDMILLAEYHQALGPGPARMVAELFVEQIELRLSTIQSAVTAGDLAAVRNEAHAMKGSAAQMGAEPLRALASELVQVSDIAAASGLAARLPAMVEECRTAISHWLAGAA